MTYNGKLLFELLHGRTLSALANEMGVSISNLSRVLNGKGCTKNMADKLNKHFGITNGGFVVEKRDYESEKKPKESKTISKRDDKIDIEKINKIFEEGRKQFKEKKCPLYEVGHFVLYPDGKVGQIRKIITDRNTKEHTYKVRLVEWCRPKEYTEHQRQYNILDNFVEKDIKRIDRGDIKSYKEKYEKSLNKTENKNENNDPNIKSNIQNIVDSMSSNRDINFRSIQEKNTVDKLLEEWEKELPFNNVSVLTSDEKLVILKQIIYKLLTII